MTDAIKAPDLSKVTREHLMHLLEEAQNTTMLLLSWSGTFDMKTMKSKSSSVDLSPYYLKWIDIATITLANMKDPIDDTVKKQLIDDLATIAIVPIKGMQMALRVYAKSLNVELPESQTSKIDDISLFKKVAIAELEQTMEVLKKAQADKDALEKEKQS